MKHKLQRFLALPADQRRLFWRALFWLPLTAVGLRLYGFNRWYRSTRRWAGHLPLGADDKEAIPAQQVSYLVELANRYGPYRGNCLQRSLVLWYLLRCQGIDSDLRIGVRKQQRASAGGQLAGDGSDDVPVGSHIETARFEAHAWVEREGAVLNDAPEIQQHFAAFPHPIFPAGAKIQ
jgi:hypothetical protein